jgi:hypothetical protein
MWWWLGRVDVSDDGHAVIYVNNFGKFTGIFQKLETGVDRPHSHKPRSTIYLDSKFSVIVNDWDVSDSGYLWRELRRKSIV